MKRALKMGGVVVVLLILVAAGVAVKALGWRTAKCVVLGPAMRPLTDRHFAATPERLERGRYLVEDLTHCTDCHSPLDHSDLQHVKIPPGKEGAGKLIEMKGLPGTVYTPNITPDKETGIGTWSDDAIARAIREGVSADGRALFTMMPYQNLRHLSDEDLASVVVYLRTLKPVHNAVPTTRLNFPVNFLNRAVPEPLTGPVAPPDMNNPVARGRYLVTLGNCHTCHTPTDAHGQPLPGMDYAGGRVFDDPWGRVVSPNLTPDPSGISYYDEKMFIEVMRTGRVGARVQSPPMPWQWFRHLSDDDLKAMFAYLRTLKPVRHRVDNTEPPTYCRICGQMHGSGDKN